MQFNLFVGHLSTKTKPPFLVLNFITIASKYLAKTSAIDINDEK